jgi:hypothetical protein
MAAAEPEPEPEPEPELAVAEHDGASHAPIESPQESRGRWWRRKRQDEAGPAAGQEPPRHVRILAADEEDEDDGHVDPWEQGFDEAVLEPEPEPGEDTAEGEPALSVEREDAEQHTS